MLPYIFAGLALGSIYALAASSLVVTYVSTGVVNFAFGATAFVIARLYYWLHSEKQWPILPAAAVSLLVVGPALGAALYGAVFRHLRLRSQLVRVVVTIGVSVALPPAAAVLMGNKAIPQAPGLAPTPVRVFHLLGAAVNLDQVIVYAALVVVVGVGVAVLRLTDVGLKVRAMVDSPALTGQSGVNPTRVSLGVWAVCTALSGLAGILVAPTQGLTPEAMTLLMASAFAAVVAGRLHSLPAAVAAALATGVITDVIQKYLPSDSAWSTNLVPAIPFCFIVVFLVVGLFRSDDETNAEAAGGALDRAITPPRAERGTAAAVRPTPAVWALRALPILVLGAAPLLVAGYWLNLLAEGLALGIALLSYTVVTGEGGMIWLCQITFAGGGAAVAAELVANHGFSPLLAGLLAAAAMVPVGGLVGLLTLRFGDLHVALVTLSFGLLIDVLLFRTSRLYQNGLGVNIGRPSFAADDRAFCYLCLAIFLILGLVVANFRRSTAGMAMAAVRSSPVAARTVGISVIRTKLMVSTLSTFIAGLGGALLAMWNGSSQTSSFGTFQGLIWLAVVVTIGVRSIVGAAVAGLAFTMLANVFSTYLPADPVWLQIPTVLFGLGAISIARNPAGVAVHQARALTALVGRRRAIRTGAIAAEAG